MVEPAGVTDSVAVQYICYTPGGDVSSQFGDADRRKWCRGDQDHDSVDGAPSGMLSVVLRGWGLSHNIPIWLVLVFP